MKIKVRVFEDNGTHTYDVDDEALIELLELKYVADYGLQNCRSAKITIDEVTL